MADRSEITDASTSLLPNLMATKVDPTSARFEANMRFLADLMSQADWADPTAGYCAMFAPTAFA